MDSYPPSQTLSKESLYHHLNQVSRSFAITIPFLAEPLRDQVGLAYLLCRIVDTVEDDSQASIHEKITWLSDFAFLAGDEFAEKDVLLRLQERALEITKNGSAQSDRLLLEDLVRSVNLLLTYDESVQETICHGVSILSYGMASSLRKIVSHEEICNVDDVDNYCYFVAGVVGEMLAELFCFYDHKIDKKEIMDLSVSFGEGLQLTNILRDRAKDEERGASFLPTKEEEGVLEYVALTQGHLDDAICFIAELPVNTSYGVRMFCFTNVIMAMYLLRQVAHRPLDPKCNYKISRFMVKHLFALSKLVCRSNRAMKFLAFLVSIGMKRQRRSARQLRDKVSIWDHSSTTN